MAQPKEHRKATARRTGRALSCIINPAARVHGCAHCQSSDCRPPAQSDKRLRLLLCLALIGTHGRCTDGRWGTYRPSGRIRPFLAWPYSARRRKRQLTSITARILCKMRQKIRQDYRECFQMRVQRKISFVNSFSGVAPHSAMSH